MRAAYARLLETHDLGASRDALKALEAPLCQLWISAYKRAWEHETYLEMLDDRVSSYLHDSAASMEIGPVNRVVAAVSVSQDMLPLGDLLGRLQAEARAGLPRTETLSLIHQAFVAFRDGLSARNLELLTQAAARILGWDRDPTPVLIERWIGQYRAVGLPRLRARLLKRVLAVLASSMRAGKLRAQSEVKPGESVPSEELDRLRALAMQAERDLGPEARAVLALELAGLIPGALGELERLIATGWNDELRERIEEHILKLGFVHGLRPRYSKGARHRRTPGMKTDFGHFIAHSTGGPADINLFHQDRRLNRGWSVQGRAYRSMEKYLASHPGLFHFTRAEYEDDTEMPRYLEVGILLPRAEAEALAGQPVEYEGLHVCFPGSRPAGADLAWWIGVFDNRPSAGEL